MSDRDNEAVARDDQTSVYYVKNALDANITYTPSPNVPPPLAPQGDSEGEEGEEEEEGESEREGEGEDDIDIGEG